MNLLLLDTNIVRTVFFFKTSGSSNLKIKHIFLYIHIHKVHD